ncbi:MAG: hypothetical protein QW594_03160 [Candidatus Woesearchaeota archaeon]
MIKKAYIPLHPINQKDIELLKTAIQETNKKKERIREQTTTIVLLSKKIIHALHQEQTNHAREYLQQLNQEVTQQTKKKLEENNKIALQEYVEALAYYWYTTKKSLLPFRTVAARVEYETYLLGIADMTGELVRNAVHATISKKYEEVFLAHAFTNQLYCTLIQLPLRSEARKAIDSIRWNLRKLDEMVVALALNNSIPKINEEGFKKNHKKSTAIRQQQRPRKENINEKEILLDKND